MAIMMLNGKPYGSKVLGADIDDTWAFKGGRLNYDMLYAPTKIEPTSPFGGVMNGDVIQLHASTPNSGAIFNNINFFINELNYSKIKIVWQYNFPQRSTYSGAELYLRVGNRELRNVTELQHLTLYASYTSYYPQNADIETEIDVTSISDYDHGKFQICFRADDFSANTSFTLKSVTFE